MKALSLPSLFGKGASKGAEADKNTAADDFDIHTGAAVSDAAALPINPPAAAAEAARPSGLRAASQVESAQAASAVPSPRARGEERQDRSAYFNLTLAAVTGLFLALTVGMTMVFPGLAPASFGAGGATPAVAAFLHQLALALGAATGVTVLGGIWELSLFTAKVALQKPVSDEQFMDFVRKEIPRWGLHPSVAANLMGTGPGQDLLKPYRPASRFDNLVYGFIAGGQIYIRPELVRTPWLFRWVLKHELFHLQKQLTRGPPARHSTAGEAVRGFLSEFGARIREFGGKASLQGVRLPSLERVLQESKLSLRVTNPYDLLIVGPSQDELRHPSAYEKMSGGKAHVEVLPARAAMAPAVAAAGDMGPLPPTLAEYLERDENAGRFRFVVYSEAYDQLPAQDSLEGKRLRAALDQLDEIYRLERQVLKLSEDDVAGSRELLELQRVAAAVGAKTHGKSDAKNLDKMIEDMYFQVARNMLAQTSFGQTLDALYEKMHYKGAVLMPFADGDPGLAVLERVLRYWRASDTGGFAVRRVDMPEGGHVLVARRVEPRTELWLKPKDGRTIAQSVTNVASGTLDPAQQEKLLRDAGFQDPDLKRFRDAGLIIRHVFGADVGENRIFVTVKKAHAKTLKRYADKAGIIYQQSTRGYQLHLLTSGPIEKLDGAWKLGFKGEGQKIYDIDTGLDVSHPDFSDRDLIAVDFVDDGPEDWVGHGTHKAGISYANGTLYKGMAPKATGRMGKVFAQTGFGASDGDIMAAAVDAMKWGADVISLSLGSPGAVEAPLAVFFSNLTRQKNANGHYPIVTASAGNSGPFLATKSQPSVGEFVASITAAAKSADDGQPEISFYSSVGPGMDQRFSRKRYRRPMGITALGGDVTTPPGVKDVYSQGIESAKSKSMEASPSDTEDGKHTRMSGTSMSNPMVAGIAALVKQAILKTLTAGTPAFQFFMDELPFAVNMILMRSADDMRVPYEFQEGGFVNAEAAVKLGMESFGGAPAKVSTAAGRLASGFLSMFQAAPAAAAVSEVAPSVAAPYDWIRRAKAVWALEDRVFQEAETARQGALPALDKLVQKALEEQGVGDQEKKVAKMALGNAAGAIFDRRFNEVTAEVLPDLIKALKDDVWVVRMYAAFALLNIKTTDADAVQALTEAGLNDPEGRVRRIALMAVGDTGTRSTDEALRKASQDQRPDVGMYAAYALARHGDPSAIGRIIAETRSEDKKVRHTAIWLLGQLAERAPPEAVDALAERVKDAKERGNLQHLGVASLTYFAVSNPDVVTPKSISGLLAASGPQNFALTRTISKFFIAAARSAALKAKMQEEPLKAEITAFVTKYKQSATKPGALGDLVKLLARIVNIPMDMPTPLPDPTGAGIPGVDANLGPVHLIVELPEGAKARIEKFQDFRGQSPAVAMEAAESFGLQAALERFDASLQAAMPTSQAFWVNMPDAKVLAFSQEMEAKGYRVRRAAPMYRLLNDTAKLSGIPEVRASHGGLDGKGVLVAYLDEGGDAENPAFAGRIKARANFSGEGAADEVGPEGVGHGTHGMGIVGATSIDGSPYVGMAPGVEFAVGKVLGASGGSEATVMAGMEWAATLVADPLKTPLLVNMSLGGPGEPDNALGRLVNKLRLKNIGVVIAAGNSGPAEGTVSSPANAPLAIAIGAVAKDKTLADYSSRSVKGQREISWVDFGGAVFLDRPNLYEIISTLNSRLAEAMKEAATLVKWNGKPLYQTMSGTSMATPHSTGKLSLLVERMRQAFKDGLPDGYLFFLEDLVESTARKVPGTSEHEVGAGLIDMPAALAALDQALISPATIQAKSAEMLRKAKEQYGAPAAPVKPASRLSRLAKALSDGGTVLGSWFSSMTSLFLMR